VRPFHREPPPPHLVEFRLTCPKELSKVPILKRKSKSIANVFAVDKAVQQIQQYQPNGIQVSLRDHGNTLLSPQAPFHRSGSRRRAVPVPRADFPCWRTSAPVLHSYKVQIGEQVLLLLRPGS
jgi:hypothetical protein